MFHKKLNTEGFSLVEILVSMVILGIIFIPLTKNFVVAMQANEKAKLVQQATAIGQSVMEDFKADELIDLKNEYNLESGDPDTAFPGVYKQDISAGGRTYKATITVSSSGDTAINTINGTTLAEIYSMNSSSNSIHQEETLSDWVLTAYKEHFALSDTIDELRANMTRNYCITIGRDDSTGYAVLSYEVKYIAENHSDCEYIDTESTSEVMSADLKNIFFYYSIDNAKTDTITVTNDNNFCFDFYIIGTPSDSAYASNTTINCAISGYTSDPSSSGIHVKSNVTVHTSTGDIAPVTDTGYVTNGKTKNRRYAIEVLIQNEDGDTYAKLDSIRGE